MKRRKGYITNYIANSHCLFCGMGCGHIYEGKIKQYQKGRFDFVYVENEKTKDVVIYNFDDRPILICKNCFKELFLKAVKNE